MVSGDLCPDSLVRRLFDWSQCPCAADVTMAGISLTSDAKNHQLSALTVSQVEGISAPIYVQMELTGLRLTAPLKPHIPLIPPESQYQAVSSCLLTQLRSYILSLPSNVDMPFTSFRWSNVNRHWQREDCEE